MRLATAGALALLVLSTACGGGDGPSGPSGNNLPNGSFSARVDGTNFNVASATVLVTSTGPATIISVAGGTLAGHTVGFAWVDAGPGTYTISNASAANGLYTQSGAHWSADPTQGSGTIIITTRTSSRVAGTFSLVLMPSFGSASGTKNVTNGKFDLTF